MPVYNITFKTEGQFTCCLELSQYQLSKLKKCSGKKGMLGGNDKKDAAWIKFLMQYAEFDVAVDSDIEDMIIEHRKIFDPKSEARARNKRNDISPSYRARQIKELTKKYKTK
jgi:hypothetical protein